MNRKSILPAVAVFALAGACIGVEAGITSPARQPVNNVLDTAFGSDGISVQAGAAHRQAHATVARPQADPALDRADAAAQGAIDTAGAALITVSGTAHSAATTAATAVAQALATVNNTVSTSGSHNAGVPSPLGPATWNERQLMQRTIRFDTGGLTAHTVEVRAEKNSARMYSVQAFVDGRPSGRQVNVYGAGLQLEKLDVPIVVPPGQGSIDIAVSYGYYSSGNACLLSIGNDDAACAAAAPDPIALAQLRPQVTIDLGWQMLGRPAGNTSVHTPLS